jgi:hypothetical protein
MIVTCLPSLRLPGRGQGPVCLGPSIRPVFVECVSEQGVRHMALRPGAAHQHSSKALPARVAKFMSIVPAVAFKSLLSQIYIHLH